jgi:spermidine synthase
MNKIYIDNISISVKIIKSAPIADLTALYKSAGWWDAQCDHNPEFVNHIVKNSAFFAGAFIKDKMVGMGRVLSDMVSDAYIHDVAVLDQYKDKGIGKMIVALLVKELRLKKIDWIGLIACPETSSFYKKLGFEQLKDYTPMKYMG